MSSMMGEVEKPFCCPEVNCGLSFTNEDHLEVHRRHHKIQLSINTAGSTQQLSHLSSLEKSGCLLDQTPTPSRFLKHCDDVNLFSDINLNPFDLEFRKASQFSTQLSVNEVPGISVSLETPKIPVDSDETISSTSHDGVHNISLQPSSSQIICSTGTVSASSSLNTPRLIHLETDHDAKERKKLTLNVSSASDIAQSSNVISTPTPVITAGPSVGQSLSSSTLNTPNIFTSTNPHITLNGSDLELNTPTISPSIRLPSTPTSVLTHSNFYEATSLTNLIAPMPATVDISSASIVSQNASTMPNQQVSTASAVLQLVLRLPNGQSLPVEIPATPVASSMSSTIVAPSKPVIATIAPSQPLSTYSMSSSNAPVTSVAKLKLKEVLASSCTAARPGVNKHSRATTADRIAEMTRNRNQSGTSSNGDDYFDDSNSSCSSSANVASVTCSKLGRRRRNTDGEETPDEKRRKFLERNRAAAVKCREKKKRLVQSIAVKSAELSTTNQRLLNEVSVMRSEIASLKSLLLRHKNCPVTLAMKGEEEASFSEDQVPQTFTTYLVQDPSGIITEVTTRPPTTSGASPKQILAPKVPVTTDGSFQLSKAAIANCKIRKRSLSLSALSAMSTLEEEEPELPHPPRDNRQILKLPNGTLVYCSAANTIYAPSKTSAAREEVTTSIAKKTLPMAISPTVQNLGKLESSITKVRHRQQNLGIRSPISRVSGTLPIRPHPSKSETTQLSSNSFPSFCEDASVNPQSQGPRIIAIKQPNVVSRIGNNLTLPNSSKIFINQNIPQTHFIATTKRTDKS